MNQISPLIESQYQQENLYENIIAALAQKGVNPQALGWKNLTPVDEFHVRGLEATLELAQQANLRSGTKVLDVGCGIGGAARLLAAQYDCKVTGIDLVPEYIRTAKLLTAQVGLNDMVSFLQADALDMPFGDGQFDVVWTQHAQMNIEDKQAFYNEMARVLRADGQLIYYDILANSDEPLQFPVPWAEEEQASFLTTPTELEQMLRIAGFEEIVTLDLTEKGLLWFLHRIERIKAKGMPTLGLQLLMGKNAVLKMENLAQNLADGKIMLQSGIYQKAS